jgi:phosphatidylserine decarboxylase
MVRDGYIYALVFVVVAAFCNVFTKSFWLSLIPLLLAAFFLWFFRDPHRTIPTGIGLIVSPGDGRVTETASITTPQGAMQRISIFLSVFDVHVNRAPISGIVSRVHYQKGQFLNAMNPASAERNEQSVVTLRGQGADAGFEITFKQIAGLLARRIVCRCAEGQSFERGQHVGLIKFGSRVDVLLPANAELRVRVGDRVKGGASVLAAVPAGVADAHISTSSVEAGESVEPGVRA